MKQPRPLRSASERNIFPSERGVSPISSTEARSPPKEDHSIREKARTDPLYDAKPDKNGKYICPKFIQGQCNHPPTQQRCVYNKYVDSHLRPYRCKFSDKSECEELRFSSNACLLRHEREAHGEHSHGVNPYLCIFKDCERARPGMGFPRRWNQRDHMKRVHQHEEADSPPKKSSTSMSNAKRRKCPNVPTSTAMRRSSSSTAAKVQAMSKASVQVHKYGPISRTQYGIPEMYPVQCQDYDDMIPLPMSMFDVQLSQPLAASRTSRISRTSSSSTRAYPS